MTDRTRPPIPRPVRIAVVSAAAVWIVVAVSVLVVHRLPAAEATGHLEREGAAFQPYLGSGWYPMELAVRSDEPGRPPTMIASNWSDAARSTLRVPAGWPGVRLLLAGITCANGTPEVLRLSSGGGASQSLRIRPGWNWYGVALGGGGASRSSALRTVRIAYSCTVRQSLGGVGLPGHPLAVAIGGLGRAPGR